MRKVTTVHLLPSLFSGWICGVKNTRQTELAVRVLSGRSHRQGATAIGRKQQSSPRFEPQPFQWLAQQHSTDQASEAG